MRISSTETSEIEKQTEKRLIKQNRTSKGCGTTDATYTQQQHQKEQKKEVEEISEETMTENVPQINVRQQNGPKVVPLSRPLRNRMKLPPAAYRS